MAQHFDPFRLRRRNTSYRSAVPNEDALGAQNERARKNQKSLQLNECRQCKRREKSTKPTHTEPNLKNVPMNNGSGRAMVKFRFCLVSPLFRWLFNGFSLFALSNFILCYLCAGICCSFFTFVRGFVYSMQRCYYHLPSLASTSPIKQHQMSLRNTVHDNRWNAPNSPHRICLS